MYNYIVRNSKLSYVILTILGLLTLANVWVNFTPSSTELALGTALKFQFDWLDESVVRQLSDSVYVCAFLALFAGIGCIIMKRYASAAIAGLALFSVVLVEPVKNIIQRPRPDSLLDIVPLYTGFGFPSGHSLAAIVLPIALLLVYRHHNFMSRQSLNWVISGIVVYALLIGWTRIWLGVHYVSDVIASYLIGLIIALMLVSLHRSVRSK